MHYALQSFRQGCLLEQPAMSTLVQISCGKTLCARKGVIAEDSYQEIAAHAIFAAADGGYVILHTTAQGSVASLNLRQPGDSKDAESLAGEQMAPGICYFRCRQSHAKAISMLQAASAVKVWFRCRNHTSRQAGSTVGSVHGKAARTPWP